LCKEGDKWGSGTPLESQLLRRQRQEGYEMKISPGKVSEILFQNKIQTKDMEV
jgi:hypothetical protein